MNINEKACPFCGEVIKEIAIKCKHCQSDLSTENLDSSLQNQIDIKNNDRDNFKSNHGESEKRKRSLLMDPVFGVTLLIMLVFLFYFLLQPSCESDWVKKTLLSLLDEKVLYLKKYGLTSADVTKDLSNVTSVSSREDAKSCVANLVITFSSEINEKLRKIALSKQEPDILDPYFATKFFLKNKWSESRGGIEVMINFRHTQKTVIIGGGMEGIALLGLEDVVKYVAELKSLPSDQSGGSLDNHTNGTKKIHNNTGLSTSTPENTSRVNMENYSRLQMDMSYDEAVEIFGKDGEEMSSTDIAGFKTVMYKWTGDSRLGANVVVMFQNGKLIQKAQYGLQ